jgi:hypothetical protein
MNDNSERCSLLDISGKKQTELTAYFKRPAKRILPTAAQSDIRRADALFVGGCHLSFRIVDNTHFRRFCLRLVQTGT